VISVNNEQYRPGKKCDKFFTVGSFYLRKTVKGEEEGHLVYRKRPQRPSRAPNRNQPIRALNGSSGLSFLASYWLRIYHSC
jgi:hypothetical protein